MIRVITSERDSVLSTGQVAPLIRMSRRNVLRIPRDRLDYWETPGGQHRQHRRYAFTAVQAYAERYRGLILKVAQG